MNRKKVLALGLAGSMLLGTVTTSALAVDVNQLVDVEKTDWFYPYVQYVAERDYMQGISSNKFAPEMEMTRAMFATVLYRMENPTGVSEESMFVDVPNGTWYTQAVNWAGGNKIVNGIGGNKFNPEAPITREQICTMVARYLEYAAAKHNKLYKTTVVEKTFPDANLISDFAKDAVKKCQMWGLVEGNEKGYMNPQDNATRAEVAAVIERLNELMAAGVSVGGGGSTPTPATPTTETATYTVRVKLDMPASVSGAVSVDPDFAKNYTVTITNGTTISGDKTLAAVINELIAESNTDTTNKLTNGVQQALDKVKGKEFTQTVKGHEVTVKIDADGVISAAMSVDVNDFADLQTQATQTELENLISKLQNGEMSFTAADVPVMADLLDRVADVVALSDSELEAKVKEVASQLGMEQLADGMDAQSIRDAANTYTGELEKIKTEVEKQLEENPGGTVTLDRAPVLMKVSVNLEKYLDKAGEKFTEKENAAINKLEAELYQGTTKQLTADQETAARALYNLNDPENYVEMAGEGKLKLKSVSDYVDLIRNNVLKSVAFYESLNTNLADDPNFYLNLLTRAEDKYTTSSYKDYITYDVDLTKAAALLSDPDGIFVDENKDFRDTMTFQVKADVSEASYDKVLEFITGKWSSAGDILPTDIPAQLSKLIGEYTLTVSITKGA